MEHLSPGLKVMTALADPATAHRQPDISGIACAAAVGHNCGALVGQVAAGADAAGAAHPAITNTANATVILLAKSFL